MSSLPRPRGRSASAVPTIREHQLRSVGACDEPSGLPVVVGADLEVPTREGLVRYAHLDHAASTPALVSVTVAVQRALETYSSVHRGAGWASRVTSRWYEQARLEVGEFVGARPEDAVVFTRTTTDSWNLLSRALPSRTTVFVFDSEHHSTLLPWGAHRTVRLPVPANIEDALELLTEALDEHAARHRLVVITAASNVTGETWPVERFAAVAHEHRARLAVDAAQLAPHRRIDLATWGADYVAFSGHKTYAPFGAGVLIGRQDWLDAGRPYLYGGGATRSVTADRTVWATGPARHEGGSPNVVGAIALAAACAALRRHRGAIEAHESALLTRLCNGLAEIPGVELLSLFGPDHDRVGVVAFTVAGYDPALVSQVLSHEHGIGVRDGKFCAHVLVDELLEDPWGEQPGTAVRASIGLGTTAGAVERLVDGVRRLVASGPADRWVHEPDGWVLLDGDRRSVASVPRPW